MKVSVLTCGGSFGGGISHANNVVKALKKVGVEAELVTHSKIGDPDIIFMDSFGMTGEKNIKANQKRLDYIKEYFQKVPFVMVRHGITEPRIFKHSYEFFKDFEWDLIVSIENSEGMFGLIRKEHRFKNLVYVCHAFEFRDELFADKTPYKNVIVSPGRFASCKHNNQVLNLANLLRWERKFLIAGYEKGIYWYRNIREHPNRAYAKFIGGYEDYAKPYEEAAWGIDLAYIQGGGIVNSNAFHHTVIETIDCGCIPIKFDTWKHTEIPYEAIWLPSPKKVDRKMFFDVEKYAEIIRSYDYDFDVALYNRELLKLHCDLEKVGNRYKALLENLL